MNTLVKGTVIYHGTRWREGQIKWWEKGFPNKEGEDGGVSYSLDDRSSPKIRMAQVVIQYKLIKDLDYLVCNSKADFYPTFSNNPEILACWTRVENELSMRLMVQGVYLKYHTDSTQSACTIM